MTTAVLLLLITLANHEHRTIAVTAPSIETCRANQPAIEKIEAKGPHVVRVQGICLEFAS